MTATSGKKTSSSQKSTNRSSAKKSSAKQSNTRKKNTTTYQNQEQDSELYHEIGLIVLFVAVIILFLCNFGVIGPVGNAISRFLFGVFGLTAYIAPIAVFLGTAFWLANEGNPTAVRKLIAGIVLFVMAGVICDLIMKNATGMETYDVMVLYKNSSASKKGGGVLAGSLTYFLYHYLETIGTVLVVLLCCAVSLILLTEKSLLRGVKQGGSRVIERSKEEKERRREYSRQRRLEQEEARQSRAEQKRLRAEEKKNERILRMDKQVTGVMLDTELSSESKAKRRDDIHEITVLEDLDYEQEQQSSDEDNSLPIYPVQAYEEESIEQQSDSDSAVYKEEWLKDTIPDPVLEATQSKVQSVSLAVEENLHSVTKTDTPFDDSIQSDIEVYNEENPMTRSDAESRQRPAVIAAESMQQTYKEDSQNVRRTNETEKLKPKVYQFPSLGYLKKGVARSGDSTKELKETAMRLQQTLATFGVGVQITDISQGPSVTRYELQPEQGVKVSRIVNLTDDIKLNLAATDIRIEAPIPGKAAVGIEVPNKENMMVALRDLLESKEFREFSSNLAFAVGKDIAGKVVVADIAKMPHMLIAGATGSGKSVCINTLIMSILYKAHPEDVKLIMVDPKVVELSVYNGIPHLLIPVVTDPKKAAGALHWGVAEMEDRYRKFAEHNVRDLKGYNKKMESLKESGQQEVPVKMPQIIIIVDELADLMMVSPGEVEESICRLAQLARAAGIHLIIATQRPSVDVITGLIKANMPSRVAFSVSSGVDSRTILDMNGAEKLLGKGDMLFYPQGYSKPARVQGAFVSDKEVSDVVDFLKNQTIGNIYAQEVEEKIKNIGSSGSSAGGGSNSRDEYFADAGKFIIDKDKASIGMLQRALKIGFNRAARIMDQLCDYGVVGEEEGTKPRKVLMSMEQFEQLLEEL